MTLRTKLVYARAFVWLGAVAVCLGLAAALHATPVYFLPVVVLFTIFAPRRLGLLMVRRAYRRLGRLNEAQDFEASRRLIVELREIYLGSRTMTEQLRLQESIVHSLSSRHAEAVAMLSSIDRACLGAPYVPLLLNNLAWSLALSGNPAAAVQRARESMAASDTAGDRAVTAYNLRGYQLGTLGTALVLAGEPDEGVPYLEQALARGGKPREQSIRAFYLGEGLRALGRHAEAAKAYERAVKEAPDGEHARRAGACLEGLSAYRS